MTVWALDVRNTATGRGAKIMVDAETMPEAVARALLALLLPEPGESPPPPLPARPACLMGPAL